MKILIVLVCVCLLTACAPVSPLPNSDVTQSPAPRFTVALDIGHGGFDGGAVGVDSGVHEAKLNLEVGLLVKAELEEMNIAVFLTRGDENALGEDKHSDMKVRAELLSKEGYDAVVSIHMNKFKDRKVNGPMAYYQSGSEAGESLAQYVIDSVCCALERPSRGANPGNNLVTRVPIVAAVLVECGFLSNSEDERLLQDAEYQALLAEAIAAGVAAWLEDEYRYD